MSGRVCDRIEELSVSVGVRMGMSAGLVVVDGTRDANGVLDAADRAMYSTKARPDGPMVVVAGTNATLAADGHEADSSLS